MSSKITNLNAAITSPARLFTWDIDFAPAVLENTSPVKVRAQSTSIPGMSISEIDIFNWGLPAKFAGQVRFDNRFDIMFVEDEDYKVFDFFHTWRELVVSAEDTHVNPKTDYAYNISLFLMDVKNATTLKTFTLANSWPLGIGQVPLDKSNASTPVRFNITFAYDFYTVTSSA